MNENKNGIKVFSKTPPKKHLKPTITSNKKPFRSQPFDIMKGVKMVEMRLRIKGQEDAHVVMPSKYEWVQEYLADGWKIVNRWINTGEEERV